jgi:hypothetical protein
MLLMLLMLLMLMLLSYLITIPEHPVKGQIGSAGGLGHAPVALLVYALSADFRTEECANLSDTPVCYVL